jgi:hypothetical protein
MVVQFEPNKSLLCLASAFSIGGGPALALSFLVETQPFQLPVSMALLADISLAETNRRLKDIHAQRTA